MTHESLTHLFSHITAHTLVLTPNRRLSATLHKLYQAYQIDLKQMYWETPDIVPLSTWLQRMFAELTATYFDHVPILLNTIQESFLWEMIITSSPMGEYLLQISETADTIQTAYELIHEWQVDITQDIFNSAEDYQALQQCIQKYKQTCLKLNRTDTTQLPALILKKITSLPEQIFLVGFTELSPQAEQLFQSFIKFGTKVNHYAMNLYDAKCTRITLLDSEAEILTQARWAYDILQQFPKAKIGCVLPNLDKIRDRVKQIFLSVFKENHYFNISAGKTLSHYPIIQTALHLLGLEIKKIATVDLNILLFSPFMGEAESEYIKRAQFNYYLRKENINTIDLSSLEVMHTKCPHLAKRIKKFIEYRTQQEKLLAYHDWAQVFCELLNILGWPGERSLQSEEYQVVDSWLNLLNEYGTLDQISEPVSYQKALHTLHKLVSKNVFQAKTPEASVQILGALEAAALPFDYLWVAGMDDTAWPPAPNPNPFIPKKIQREMQMPHATAERELMFCRSIIKQYQQSAKEVIFSFASKKENLEVEVSPLIRDLPEIELVTLKLSAYQTLNETIYAQKQLEQIIDEIAPPLSENEKVRGGMNVMKYQSLCPFKSFTEWRLQAHTLETISPGLRAKDRGILIHKALELIWNQLGDQETLLKLDEQALNDIISHSIHESFALIKLAKCSPKYIALEQQRLFQLVYACLTFEKNRPPFKVLATEKSKEMMINQLTLKGRIDRIDQLENGKWMIIDYKTRKNNSLSNWFSKRPEEPQLLLYALNHTEEIASICYAELSAGHYEFKGISSFALNTRGVKVISEIKATPHLSWEEQLISWRNDLNQIAYEFCQGFAKVEPKHPINTCNQCSLHPLCRIKEQHENDHELHLDEIDSEEMVEAYL